MPTFVLTARHDSHIGGQDVSRGQVYIINVGMMGITPTNLLGNSRCVDTVLRQFSSQGLDLPKNSPLLASGHWDIKMR